MKNNFRKYNFELTATRFSPSNINDPFNNDTVLNTVSHQCTPNGQYKIALTSGYLNDFVCSWIVEVHNCEILHTKSMEEDPKLFRGQLLWMLYLITKKTVLMK